MKTASVALKPLSFGDEIRFRRAPHFQYNHFRKELRGEAKSQKSEVFGSQFPLNFRVQSRKLFFKSQLKRLPLF